jgi:hypothetical protein
VPVGRSSRKGVVEKHLRHHLARLADAKRIGLITFQPDVRQLFGDNSPLSASQQARFAKWAYYGEGVDRASNDWVDHCDHLIVLGTPHVPNFAVRTELVRRLPRRGAMGLALTQKIVVGPMSPCARVSSAFEVQEAVAPNDAPPESEYVWADCIHAADDHITESGRGMVKSRHRCSWCQLAVA